MPKLLSKPIKKEMISKLKDGVSINNISKELSLAKSTIYHHYRKINGKKFVEPSFESKLSKDEGELLGIIIGDGSLIYNKKCGNYRIVVYFGNGNFSYGKYIQKLFERFIGKKVKICPHNDYEMKLLINSKKVYEHFKSFVIYEKGLKHSTVGIKKIEELPFNLKVGILKGLIDTDGCVSREKATGRYKVQFFTTSYKLCNHFKTLVEELGFECGIYTIPRKIKKNPSGNEYLSKEYHSVYLLKKDVLPFIELVKPYKAKKWGLID